MNLTDFLTARIAEDETSARGIAAGAHEDAVSTTRLQSDHVFRWSPARVLAECEAKRRIVEWAADVDADYAGAAGPTETLLPLLALPYADHEDYQADWRP